LGGAEVRKPLARLLLKDQNAGVRSQAIDLLLQNGMRQQ